MKILISGGAGYIGSIIAGSFKRAGHEPVIIDSLSGGNKDFTNPYSFYEADAKAHGNLLNKGKQHTNLYT